MNPEPMSHDLETVSRAVRTVFGSWVRRYLPALIGLVAWVAVVEMLPTRIQAPMLSMADESPQGDARTQASPQPVPSDDPTGPVNHSPLAPLPIPARSPGPSVDERPAPPPIPDSPPRDPSPASESEPTPTDDPTPTPPPPPSDPPPCALFGIPVPERLCDFPPAASVGRL